MRLALATLALALAPPSRALAQPADRPAGDVKPNRDKHGGAKDQDAKDEVAPDDPNLPKNDIAAWQKWLEDERHTLVEAENQKKAAALAALKP